MDSEDKVRHERLATVYAGEEALVNVDGWAYLFKLNDEGPPEITVWTGDGGAYNLTRKV